MTVLCDQVFPLGSYSVLPMVHLYSGVNVFVRKIAVAAASSPAVDISQEGESLHIQTSTSVRTTQVSFTVGQSFNETTVDGRPCTVPRIQQHFGVSSRS